MNARSPFLSDPSLDEIGSYQIQTHHRGFCTRFYCLADRIFFYCKFPRKIIPNICWILILSLIDCKHLINLRLLIKIILFHCCIQSLNDFYLSLSFLNKIPHSLLHPLLNLDLVGIMINKYLNFWS